MYVLNGERKRVEYLIGEEEKWFSVLVGEIKLPKVQICNLGTN